MTHFHGRSGQAFLAVAITAIAAAFALALIAAPSARSVPSGSDCLLTNTGGSLDDSLCGTSAADVMTGGAGNDTMFGRGGNDTMNGQAGEDILLGEGGNDILTGGSGTFDALTGSSGNDQLRFRDGELDRILGSSSCGSGTDSLDMDLVDFASSGGLNLSTFLGCESTTIGAVNEGPNVAISRHTPKVTDNAKVPVRLRCPTELTAPCAGTLQLGRSQKSQGSPTAYSIAPNAGGKITARLSRGDGRKLSRRGEITALAISVEQGEFGDKTTVETLALIARD